MLECVERCDLCGTDPSHFAREFSTYNNWDIYKCQNCKIVFLNPRPDKNSIPTYYSKNLNIYDPNSRKEKLKNLIMRYAGGYSKNRPLLTYLCEILSYGLSSVIHNKNGVKLLLDLGCGNGRYMYFANKNGWDVVGLDFNRNILKAVKKIEGLNKQEMFECIDADSELIPFKDELFDAVLMNHLLEHTFRPSYVLKEALRVLKKRGALIVSVPNYGSLESKIFKGYWFGLDEPRHLYHFTSETLKNYLKKIGLRVYREHYKKIYIPDDFVNFSIKRYLNNTSDTKLKKMRRVSTFYLYKYLRYFLFLFPIKKSLKYPVVTHYAQKA